jgi:hypothetical protein
VAGFMRAIETMLIMDVADVIDMEKRTETTRALTAYWVSKDQHAARVSEL